MSEIVANLEEDLENGSVTEQHKPPMLCDEVVLVHEETFSKRSDSLQIIQAQKVLTRPLPKATNYSDIRVSN